MGSRVVLVVSHPLCHVVPRLFALGGAGPGGFCLGNLSFGRPTTIVELIFYMVVVSHAVIEHNMQGVREACKHGFTAPLTMPSKGIVGVFCTSKIQGGQDHAFPVLRWSCELQSTW
jgi:hypothetical protein